MTELIGFNVGLPKVIYDPVVDGGSDSELEVFIFPIYLLFNEEPRSYRKLNDHVIVMSVGV